MTRLKTSAFVNRAEWTCLVRNADLRYERVDNRIRWKRRGRRGKIADIQEHSKNKMFTVLK